MDKWGILEGKYNNLVSDDELKRLTGGYGLNATQVQAIKKAAKVNDPVPPYSLFFIKGRFATLSYHESNSVCSGHLQIESCEGFYSGYTPGHALAHALKKHRGLHWHGNPKVEFSRVLGAHETGNKPAFDGLDEWEGLD